MPLFNETVLLSFANDVKNDNFIGTTLWPQSYVDEANYEPQRRIFIYIPEPDDPWLDAENPQLRHGIIIGGYEDVVFRVLEVSDADPNKYALENSDWASKAAIAQGMGAREYVLDPPIPEQVPNGFQIQIVNFIRHPQTLLVNIDSSHLGDPDIACDIDYELVQDSPYNFYPLIKDVRGESYGIAGTWGNDGEVVDGNAFGDSFSRAVCSATVTGMETPLQCGENVQFAVQCLDTSSPTYQTAYVQTGDPQKIIDVRELIGVGTRITMNRPIAVFPVGRVEAPSGQDYIYPNTSPKANWWEQTGDGESGEASVSGSVGTFDFNVTEMGYADNAVASAGSTDLGSADIQMAAPDDPHTHTDAGHTHTISEEHSHFDSGHDHPLNQHTHTLRTICDTIKVKDMVYKLAGDYNNYIVIGGDYYRVIGAHYLTTGDAPHTAMLQLDPPLRNPIPNGSYIFMTDFSYSRDTGSGTELACVTGRLQRALYRTIASAVIPPINGVISRPIRVGVKAVRSGVAQELGKISAYFSFGIADVIADMVTSFTGQTETDRISVSYDALCPDSDYTLYFTAIKNRWGTQSLRGIAYKFHTPPVPGFRSV